MSENRLGYAIEHENVESLFEHGKNADQILTLFKAQFPEQNPEADPSPILNILNQGNVGSCQGQSLAKCFQVCYFLATGNVLNFSAMCAYILSQKEDGLIGRDVGSTLSGGQRVAAKGICLEEAWPYSGRYDATIPNVDRPFKMVASKPTSDPELIFEAINAGLPVQTGMSWNSELEQEVVTGYTGRGARGGHATTLWLKTQNGNIRHHNSWGQSWNQDGRSEWTIAAAKQIITYRQNTFVIYAPENMVFPELPIVETE